MVMYVIVLKSGPRSLHLVGLPFAFSSLLRQGYLVSLHRPLGLVARSHGEWPNLIWQNLIMAKLGYSFHGVTCGNWFWKVAVEIHADTSRDQSAQVHC